MSTYMRPSENHALTLASIVPAAQSCSYVSLLTAPLENGIPSKNNKYDEAILLDDTRASWLGKALQIRASSRKRSFTKAFGKQPDEMIPLWGTSSESILDNVKASSSRLGLNDILTTL